VQPPFRLSKALLVSVGLACAVAPAAVSGCGPEAIGVEACRKIEGARCEAAAACGFSEEDVADCKLIYTDQCLHGIENKTHRPTGAEADACVAAVQAAGACAAAGTQQMSACTSAPVIAGSENETPCTIVLSLAHRLTACSFAETDADAGTPTTDSGSDAD
jgi:hypothetical protein